MPMPLTMLSVNTLQPPKTGRSRFSKALPAVPGLHDHDHDTYSHDASSPPASPPKHPLNHPLPLPPPPRKDSIASNNAAKSLNASLPPLPFATSSAAAPPPSAPPKMAIPRRPVGMPAQPRPPMKPQAVSPVEQVPEPQPSSPSESLSSILSAYSRSSGESLVRSSEATTSARESETAMSPRDEQQQQHALGIRNMSMEASTAKALPQIQTQNSPFIPNNVAPTANTTAAYTAAYSYPATATSTSTSAPPPPPSKDDRYNLPSASNSSNSPSSPPRPQIWRRRSLKADRSLDVPDLQLVSSHGSTASTVKPTTSSSRDISQSAQQQQLPPQPETQPQAPKASPLPPQPRGGLPGRNIRPLQLRHLEEQQQPAETNRSVQAMGNNASSTSTTSPVSKLKNLKDKLHRTGRKDSESSSTFTETTITPSRPLPQRPPTPEYQKEDIKTPILDTFVSPVSPATSPELPSNPSPVIPASKDLPREPSPKRLSSESRITRKAVPAVSPEVTATKPLPALTITPQTPASAPSPAAAPINTASSPAPSPPAALTQLPPLTTQLPIGDLAGNRSSAGSDAASSRQSQQSADAATSNKFPPRKSSSRSNLPRMAEGPRYPAELDPRLVQSDNGLLYRGRDGTLYPEMKVVQEPDPQAYYFPKQSDEFISDGAVLRAVPLRDSHYNCYHGHKTMNRRTNRNYPLTCQTCERADAEDRWSCTFCHLRVCEGCFKALNGHQRDLRLLVGELRTAA